MVVAVLELELQLDAAEIGRRRVEDEPVPPCFEPRRELTDAAVSVGAAAGNELRLAEDFDTHALRRRAAARVEDVCRERDRHARTLRLEPSSQPGQGLHALSPLELTQRRQSGWRRLHAAVDEEAGKCRKDRVHVFGR